MFYNILEHMFEVIFMLQRLIVKNYALIKELEIDFCNSLNVLTGETGSGKSMIISAINFVLGSRADKTNITTGETETKVEAVFDTSKNNKIIEELKNIDIEVGDNLIISRKLNIEGKNDIRVNGQIVNVAMLRNITCNLIDIYGQHEHQSLLDNKKHLDFVDGFLGKPIQDLKVILGQELNNLSQIESQIKQLGGDELQRQREKDMLKFQVEELENADLHIGEEEELAEKKNKYLNTQKVITSIDMALSGLANNDETNTAITSIFNAKHSLMSIEKIDSKLPDLVSRLENTKIELSDIVETLEEVKTDYDFSEEEFNAVDARLDLIKNFKRKYGNTITEMLAFLDNSRSRLFSLENSDETLLKLEDAKLKISGRVKDICNNMSSLRKSASQSMSSKIVEELKTLGMKGTRFEVRFNDISPTINGSDNVEFYFSANIGEDLRPISKVISGGEMSRFMLAFKVIMGQIETVDTMIFDEIDTGISGEVSQAVAEKLAHIAKSNQVITITHLPTIASMARNHYLISKKVVNNKTISTVVLLDDTGQLDEIARLAGGKKDSQIALAHATELRNRGKVFL